MKIRNSKYHDLNNKKSSNTFVSNVLTISHRNSLTIIYNTNTFKSLAISSHNYKSMNVLGMETHIASYFIRQKPVRQNLNFFDLMTKKFVLQFFLLNIVKS